MKVLAGAVLVLGIVWTLGKLWNWRKRRDGDDERVTRTWLNEHRGRQWK